MKSKSLLLLILLLGISYLACTPKVADSVKEVQAAPGVVKTEVAEEVETAVNADKFTSVSDKLIGTDPAFRMGRLENGMKYYLKKNVRV